MKAQSPGFRERGAALLFAMLLVVAMLSLLAWNQQYFDFAWQLGQSRESRQQARQYALGAEALAVVTLRRQAQQDTTHLQQLWASDDSRYPIEQGEIRGHIVDQQNCFNINGLIYGRQLNAAGVASIERTLVMQQFLSLLSLSQTLVEGADEVLERSLDWIDKDIQLAGAKGAESVNYQRYRVPFYAADAPFADLSEMLLWQLPEAERLSASSLLCARPSTAVPSLNINTLAHQDAVHLAALFFGQLSIEQAEDFIRQRPAKGYLEQGEFLPQLFQQVALSEAQKALLQQQLLVRSYWFEIVMQVNYQGNREYLRSYAWVPRPGKAKIYRRLYGEY